MISTPRSGREVVDLRGEVLDAVVIVDGLQLVLVELFVAEVLVLDFVRLGVAQWTTN